MKNILKRLSLIIVIVIPASSNVFVDSVEYSIIPKTIEMPYLDSCVNVCITNFSSDTIITIGDVFIQGGAFGKTIIHPIGKYSPNFLILKSVKFHYFLADGFFEVNYYEFPQLIVIPSNSKKLVRININSYLVQDHNNWELSGYFRFASKSKLDYLISLYYPERLLEYKHSHSISDTILSSVFPIDKLDSVYKYEEKPNLNRIQDVFE